MGGAQSSANCALPVDEMDTRPALRLLACGSVDDGKSTLIGRLLYEQHLIFDDHLSALERNSKKHGTVDGGVDFALLLDGLEAERGAPWANLAYRYFSTRRRAFTVADTPGHEQFTRNMVTGASNADLGVLLVDARKGLLTQTRRHAIIARLLGIRYVVLAVNKMDLVNFDQGVFDAISSCFAGFAESLASMKSMRFRSQHDLATTSRRAVHACLGIPVSTFSTILKWSKWGTIPRQSHFGYQSNGSIDQTPIFAVFSGTIFSGKINLGDEIAILPSGATSRLKAIIGAGGNRDSAKAGDAVTVTLADEIDVARGDLLVSIHDRALVADQFAAHLVWMSSDKLLPGRAYLMKINNNILGATVTELKYQLDIDTLAKLAAKTLGLNEVGICNLSLARPVAFDPYADNRDTGAFILIDRYSNETVAAGMIDFALRRATNIHYQALTVSKAERLRLMDHRPAVLWFTGLPARENPRLPIAWRQSCTPAEFTRCCWTATMCGTD